MKGLITLFITGWLLIGGSEGAPAPALAQSGTTPWQGFGPSDARGGARRSGQEHGYDAGAERVGISPADAAELVRQSGNRVLDVRRSDGAYLVKVLTPKGRVRIVWVDALTGQIYR